MNLHEAERCQVLGKSPERAREVVRGCKVRGKERNSKAVAIEGGKGTEHDEMDAPS